MRRTHALIAVAMSLLERPRAHHYGYDLSRSAGVRSGALYPLLTRMLNEGWVIAYWEVVDPVQKKRPARRYYELTAAGHGALKEILGDAAADPRFSSLLKKEGPK